MECMILAEESHYAEYILAIAFVLVALLLMALILLQKNRGSGLSGAFGGVGGHSAFGTKTGDFLTWVTVCLTAIFMGLAIGGNFLFDQTTQRTAQASPADTGSDGADSSSDE